MNVWLLKDGENLPVQTDARRMRTWMLADELVRRGHTVTWWSSTHSHQRKTLLFESDQAIDVETRFRLKLLAVGSYRANRSIGRLLHHRRLGRRFQREAATLPKPDVVVAAFPIIELAYEAARFGQLHGVPIVVDIRDPWPDTFVEIMPRYLRLAARIVLRPLNRRAQQCFAMSASLVACSSGFLDWGLVKAGMVRRLTDRVFYLGTSRRNSTSGAFPARIEKLQRELTGKVVFCFVGSFGHVYQLRLVCEAAAALERRGERRVHFVLAGDGQQFEEVLSASRRLSNLTVPGWLNADEVEALLAASNVGLAPIRQMAGCVPNKIFEYAAAGLPILSSLEGETAAILAKHGAGLTYGPSDLQMLLTHILSLTEQDEFRRKLAKQSLEMFELKFSADKIYSDYVDHVELIARAKPF